MVPEASRVRFKVKVPVPRPFASALVMGGTSFAALSAALNTIVFGCVFDGDDGLLLPHPAASTAIPMSTYRFICVPPDYPVRVVPCCSVFFRALEAARDVEPEIDVVRAAAAGELTQGCAETVGEIQLQGVATRTLFNGNAPLRAVRVVAVQPRRVLAGDVAGAGEPQPPSEPCEPRVLMLRVFILLEAHVVIVSFVPRYEVHSMRSRHERRGCVEG